MVEGHWLSGISSGTPGCEILFVSEQLCGTASVERIRTQCNECGHAAIRFFCERHRNGLNQGKVVCYSCKSEKIWVKVS